MGSTSVATPVTASRVGVLQADGDVVAANAIVDRAPAARRALAATPLVCSSLDPRMPTPLVRRHARALRARAARRSPARGDRIGRRSSVTVRVGQVAGRRSRAQRALASMSARVHGRGCPALLARAMASGAVAADDRRGVVTSCVGAARLGRPQPRGDVESCRGRASRENAARRRRSTSARRSEHRLAVPSLSGRPSSLRSRSITPPTPRHRAGSRSALALAQLPRAPHHVLVPIAGPVLATVRGSRSARAESRARGGLLERGSSAPAGAWPFRCALTATGVRSETRAAGSCRVRAGRDPRAPGGERGRSTCPAVELPPGSSPPSPPPAAGTVARHRRARARSAGVGSRGGGATLVSAPSGCAAIPAPRRTTPMRGGRRGRAPPLVARRAGW